MILRLLNQLNQKPFRYLLEAYTEVHTKKSILVGNANLDVYRIVCIVPLTEFREQINGGSPL